MNEGGDRRADSDAPEANPAQSGIAALKNRIKYSSQCVVVLSLTVLIGIFVQLDGMKQVNSKLLVTCILSATITGADGLFLRCFVAEFSPENPGVRQNVCIKLLAHKCSVLLMITAYLLLLLANTSHAVMVVTLIVMGALVVVLLCKGLRVDHAAVFVRHEKDLERLLDFAVDVTYILYGGLIGRVFGYFKNFTEQTPSHSPHGDGNSNNLKLPELLMFFGSLFTALGLVLSSIPPVLATDQENASGHEDQVVKGLECYNGASTALAIAAVLSLAYVFVGELMILALVPEMVAAVVWVVMDLGREGRQQGADDAAEHRPVSLTITALAFGGALGIFLKFGGSPATGYHGYHGTLFLFIATSVISGLGRTILVHRPPVATAAVYVLEFSHWTSLMAALLLLGGLMVFEIL